MCGGMKPDELEATCAAMRSVLEDLKAELGPTLTASLWYARIVNVLKDQGGKEMLDRELELRERKRPSV